MQGVALLCLANNTSLAVKDGTFTAPRRLGGDAKAVAGSKTLRALGRVKRDTLAALTNRSGWALRRLQRHTNITSELSTHRTTRLGIGVASLSLGIIGHSEGTIWSLV